MNGEQAWHESGDEHSMGTIFLKKVNTRHTNFINITLKSSTNGIGLSRWVDANKFESFGLNGAETEITFVSGRTMTVVENALEIIARIQGSGFDPNKKKEKKEESKKEPDLTEKLKGISEGLVETITEVLAEGLSKLGD